MITILETMRQLISKVKMIQKNLKIFANIANIFKIADIKILKNIWLHLEAMR